MATFPPISNDTVDIPATGMFASKDWRVINREGDNYYLACGEVVFEYPKGGNSTCIKPKFHPSWEHEDLDYHVREDGCQTIPIEDKLWATAHRVLKLTGLDEKETFNALNALRCAEIHFKKGSD